MGVGRSDPQEGVPCPEWHDGALAGGADIPCQEWAGQGLQPGAERWGPQISPGKHICVPRLCVCVCVCRVRAGSSDGHAQAAWLNPHRAGDKQHHLLIKTPIWALSTRRDRPEPQHQPANSSHREYLPAWTRNASLIIPLLGNDFFLCGPQQSLALNVTAYFIAMKTSLHSPAVLRVSGQSLGEGLLFVHRSVPHTCPHLHVPLRPRGSQCH